MALTATDDLSRYIYGHGNRYRHRLRVDGKRPNESFATPLEAIARVADILEARGNGKAAPARRTERNLTLAHWAGRVLELKSAGTNPTTGAPLAEVTLTGYRRNFAPWTDGPLAGQPIRLVGLADLEDWYALRRVKAKDHANRELAALKATVAYAQRHGAQVDAAVLTLEARRHKRRKRVALEPRELRLLADQAPAYARRLILLQGMIGNRVSELLTLTADRLDLRGEWPSMTIPPELCKERRLKIIDLLPPEVALFREQLLARRPNPGDLVFPSSTGLELTAANYAGTVMAPTARRAAKAWPAEWGPCVKFPDLTSHDLRATAVSIAAEVGIPMEATAARVGHDDGGVMVREIYDQSDPRRRARLAYSTLAPAGLLEAWDAVNEAPAPALTAVTGAPVKG